MIEKTTKCALKRTAKTVGLRSAMIGIIMVLFIAAAYFFGTILSMIESAFPVVHSMINFLILWIFAFVILFIAIFGIYDEYRKNINRCRIEKERLKREMPRV